MIFSLDFKEDFIFVENWKGFDEIWNFVIFTFMLILPPTNYCMYKLNKGYKPKHIYLLNM